MKKTLGMVLVLLCAGGLSLFASGAQEKTAIIVVDMQGDFTTAHNGSLAVAGSDADYIQAVIDATMALKEAGYPVFATQDWHPADHMSFAANQEGHNVFEAIEIDGRTQVLWPTHCVQETKGAQILLDTSVFEAVVQKGKNSQFDSYSGFQDDGGEKTEMESLLKADGITKVIVYGLATDYCVKATAVDAANAGFSVMMVEDLSHGVAPETSAQALEEMKAAGVTLLSEFDIEAVKTF